MKNDPLVLPFRTDRRDTGRAVLLTCYMTGAPKGDNLGKAGYSYDFVAELFVPLLSRWGEVIPVPNPEQNLESAASEAQTRGLDPVHVSFLPFQDVHLCRTAPNIVVPAWEFPDVPNEAFASNPHNDWPATANKCAQVLVSGPFTVQSMRKGGVRSPIHVVPIPTPDEYFGLPAWNPEQKTVLDCTAYQLPQASPTVTVTPERGVGYSIRQLGKSFERTLRRTAKRALGNERRKRLSQRVESLWRSTRDARRGKRVVNPKIPCERYSTLELSGVVYMSIFNPDDGRKNWQDLLTAFAIAMKDCEDATLVLKLITQSEEAIEKLVNYWVNRDLHHRCKVMLVHDFLSDQKMLKLAAASSYYLQSTKAEGNCLPLRNFLAAGRPGISPDHSAMGDYFDEQVGFVIESHPEPAAWPHDPQLRLRTSWGRIVWPSLVDQIRASYELAKADQAAYQAMADRSRERMKQWASQESVWNCLRQALDSLPQSGQQAATERKAA